MIGDDDAISDNTFPLWHWEPRVQWRRSHPLNARRWVASQQDLNELQRIERWDRDFSDRTSVDRNWDRRDRDRV